MQPKFTPKRPGPVRDRLREERKEEAIAELTRLIGNDAMLEKIVNDAVPELRQAVLDKLRPHLCFVPAEIAVADCPNCGRWHGSAISHECVVVD